MRIGRTASRARLATLAVLCGIALLAVAVTHVGVPTPAQAAPPIHEVVQFKGLGGSASAEWYSGPDGYPYCSGRYFYVDGSEKTQHQAGSGEKWEDGYAYVYYYKWDYCSGPYFYEYASGYGQLDYDGGPSRLTISGALELTGWKYTPYGDGPNTVAAVVDLALEADGEYSSFGQSTNSYTYPGSRYRSRYVGWTKSASMSGSFVIDGEDLLDAGEPGYESATIYTANQGQVSIYRY